MMRCDGDVNRKFGIYKKRCCGAEIVIPEGVTFPQCAEHPATEWMDITDVDRMPTAAQADCDSIQTSESAITPLGELAELLYQNRPLR
jgi:hypothetical protein